jgi:uncharacterized repeat protein (TIGR01451 family)
MWGLMLFVYSDVSINIKQKVMKVKKMKAVTIAVLLMFPAFGFGQIAPDLKSAADFAILAATEISFAPPMSTINDMDVGLYPGVRSSITGDVANLTLNGGVILAADQDPTNRLPQAKLDLLNAYLFAAAATVPAPATISGNQGGSTLAPGIYKSTSTLSIEGTPLTLNAGGDENAVWIFQIESTLTTTVGGDVILSGGAKANNVYWQVGSSATIGSGTDFKGNILALVSITMNSGATIDGRLLARNGAVTFAGGSTMNQPEESQVVQGDLAITKTATPKIFDAAGDIILYEIAVTNTGTETLTDIVVTDPSATITGGTPIASLAPGATANVTASYTITPANVNDGFFFNIATATAGVIQAQGSEIVTTESFIVPPSQVPLTSWALVLVGLLIGGFMVFQYWRSTLTRV